MTRKTAVEWRALVEEWLASGRRCEEFARAKDVRATALGWWRWKLGLGEDCGAEATRFLEVVVAEPPAHAPDLVVEVGVARVRVPVGFDAGELRRVVDALC